MCVRNKAQSLGADVAAAQLALDAAVHTLLQREPASAGSVPTTTLPEDARGLASSQGEALKIIADQLIPLLEAQDLTVLQVFADNRTTLESLPPSHMETLEAALQDMDLDAALQLCRNTVA